jgi:mono/diheme cytochrome c family protein
VIDNEQLLIVLVVILPALVLWGIFIVRAGGIGRRGRPTLGIPRALRPGLTDDVLEGRRLERVMWGTLVVILVSTVMIPVYWFPESSRQGAFVERFDEEALHRGELVYQSVIPLPEGISAVEFKEEEEAQALAMGCANCHGPEGTGGFVPGGYTDPLSGKIVNYAAPPLNNVFQRWDEEVVKFTIERGRPGTPMPTWGVQYGGPMTPQMVTDVLAYLKSLPGNQEAPEAISSSCEDPSDSQLMSCGQEIFEARCVVCHGPEGQGKEEPGLTPDEISELTGGELQPDEVTLSALSDSDADPAWQDILDQIGTWYQGMGLWEGDVAHLTEEQHFTTIYNGRRFAFMPSFGETPPQGIPAPLYPLTDSQIRAVMTYERGL